MATTLSFLKFPILPQKPHHPHSKLQYYTNPIKANLSNGSNDPPKLFKETIHLHLTSTSLPLTTLTLPFFLDTQKHRYKVSRIHKPAASFQKDANESVESLHLSGKMHWDALAVGGEFGILEGRTFALIHPIVMGGLFVFTLYAGYLGWQWRRVRTIQNEINELKKQVKPVPVTPEGSPVTDVSPSPIETKIQQLTEERKELIKGSYRDRHFNAGSILLGFGVLEAIGGGVNTWFRTGKLFPGPHLFAGAAITVLWAAAAALVPPMQKGNETARNLHIALNVLNVLLFVWQIPTGIEIVFKVFEFTKWP